MAMPHYWSAHEITQMLAILHRDNFGPVLFIAGAHRNEHAFVRVSEELAAQGYVRTSRQCRSKFKVLRQQFGNVLLDHGPDPPPRHRSPFWDEIKALWVQSNEPDPAHLFPAAAGPARGLGLRAMARIRLRGRPYPAPNAPGAQREDEDEDVAHPGMDIMQLPVTRAEMQNHVAVVQELSERVAAIEERLDRIENMLQQRNRRRPRH